MLDKRSLSNVSPALIVIFIDSTIRRLSYPILIFLMSPQFDFLPKETSTQMRFVYLSIALAINPLFSILGKNYIGTLSDIIKRKNALIITTSGMTLTLLAAGAAVMIKSFAFFVVTRALTGVFGGSKSVAMASIVDSVPKRERSRAIAITNFAYILGLIVGPILGGVFSDKSFSPFFSPETPFFIAGALSAFSIIWVIFGFIETFGDKHKREWSFSEFYTPFTRAFTHAKMRLLFPQTLTLNIALSLFSIRIWTYMTDGLNVHVSTLGLFMAMIGGVGLIATLFIVTPLTHKYYTEKIMIYGVAGLILVFLLQVFFLNLLSIWLIAIPFAIFQVIVLACAFSNASHAAQKHHQGWAMGITASGISAGWLVASLLTSLIAEITVRTALYGCIGLLLISSWLILLHCKRFHPHKTEEEIEPMNH